MKRFEIKGQNPYLIQDIETIRTPRLLIFSGRVGKNVGRMRDRLENIVPGSGFNHLCAHVKTHKSALMIQTLQNAGVSSFKASLNEAALALESGVRDLFVAYPLLPQDARLIAGLAERFPEADITVQIGSYEHAQILRDITAGNKDWHYFVDVDVGMARTGIDPNKAFQLYEQVCQWPGFRFAGLHGYDGHIHHDSRDERARESDLSMAKLVAVMDQFLRRHIYVPRLVTAGSLSFDCTIL